MATDWTKAKEIFAEAAEMPPEARGVFLDRACAAEAGLRAQVEELLKAHDAAGKFFGNPTGDQGGPAQTVAAPLREGPGTRIGPYKILQLIGEGGFGSVFMAEQEKPVSRKVALKIIKLGMDTRQVIARFEAERQALAMMDHPNIARVLDAGATETGRPFFVMDLVKGDPIAEYCDKNNLSIQERLELFAQVCQAVQHAHTKGIIHRDIKPSNILVSTQDGRPHTKVIDFGIAKATLSKLTEKTLFTEHRQLIGTPEYMSPEQAEGSLDIDTRTDVYSLGVLLYELLTGSTPFDAKSLRSAAYAEIQRIIREDEPPKPSTRLSQNTETLASVAAKRHSEPRKLGAIVRGELDWIVMKALEKDRQRRYETANGLAMDVRRYLGGEAVVAAPPSRSYRLRKFVRRNKGPVAAGLLVTLALALGVVGTTMGMVHAHKNEQHAIAEARRAEAAKEEEAKARKQAETASEFVTTVLRAGDAQYSGGGGGMEGAGQDMTILAAMENAIKDIDSGRFRDDPESEAGLRVIIGAILRNNGKYERAKPLLEHALEIREHLLKGDDPLVAISLENLALLYQDQGEYTRAEPLFTRALAIREKSLGPDDRDVATSLTDLAALYEAQGLYARAEPLYTRALAIRERVLGPDHPDVSNSLGHLGEFYLVQGQYAQAEPLLTRALEIRETALGPDNPGVAVNLNSLGRLYDEQGQYAKAEPLFTRALAITEKALGLDHPSVLTIKANLAALYWSQGKLDKSVPLFEAVLKGLETKLGRQHPGTLMTVGNLGVNYRDAGRLAEAIPLLEEAYHASKKYPQLGFSGPALFDAYTKAADAAKPGDTPKVLTLVHELVAAARGKLPKDSPELAAQLATYSKGLIGLNAWDEAAPLIRECLAIRERAQPDAWTTFNSRSIFGAVLLGQNNLADAEPLLLDGYRGMKEREATIDPTSKALRIPEALERLVRLYEAKGNEIEAAAWRSKLEAVRVEQGKTGTDGGK